MSLPDLSLRRPVGTAMACLAVAVLGVVSFTRLPVDLLPDVSFPTLTVSTVYSGAGPAEVERFVTEPIEEQLSQVAGVRSVTSRSREGQSLVRLRFHWGTDMEFAALHVRERLDNLSEGLPEGSERPTILSADPTDEPILTLAVTGRDLLSLRELAEAVFKRRLEQLDGVALAAASGGPRREIQVVVDPQRLQARGIRIEDVTRALDRANYSAPGGMVRRGRFRYSLRTLGQFDRVGELRRVAVESGGGRSGGQIRLAEVAEVREGFAERETLARYDGEPAVGIQVYKESGSNTVRVADAVGETLDQLRDEYPDVHLTVATSQATFVRNAISNVVQALLLGGLLAFVVLFLFLREPRYPVAVGTAIPLSVLAAFALCYAFDVSLNVMSLGGLALGVGMLVDNSIVVLENIFRHRDEEGAAPRAAASAGTREVAAAITASTLTTVAVFGPVLYVEGVAGALFGDLSLAVAFSLLASLAVALSLLPVLARRVAGRGPAGEAAAAGGGSPPAGASAPGGASTRGGGSPAGGSGTGPAPGGGPATLGTEGDGDGERADGDRADGDRGALRRAAGRALALARGLVGALRRGAARARQGGGRVASLVIDSVRGTARDAGRLVRRATGPMFRAFDRRFRAFAGRYESTLEWCLANRWAVVAAAVGSLAAAVLVGGTLPRSLMPRVDEGRFRVELELPVGTPLERTDETTRVLEGVLAEVPGVAGVYTRVGRSRGAELTGAGFTGLHQAALEVRLASGGPGTAEAVRRFRAGVRARGLPEGAVSVETGRATSLGRALALGEADLAVKVKGPRSPDSLAAVAESVRARVAGLPSLRDVRVDFQRAQPELSVEILRDQVARHGLTVRQVADAIESFLRGAEAERPFTRFAEKVPIRVSLPASRRRQLPDVLGLTVSGVPLSQVVRVRRGWGPVEILREDQTRTVEVLAYVSGGLGEAVASARRRIEGMELPELTTVQVGGANEEMRESFRSLLFAFGLALFLVYLILAAQFESLVQPVVILAAVPLAAIGAVVLLWVAGDGLNVMSGIGLVILIGIVVNDAIIKVDFINQRRREGMDKRQAILEAGRLRLRPIVMTTVTTVLGLTPLALGWGAGADLRAPLAVAVIGGLLSATFLTLLVVPVVYSLVVDPAVPVAGPDES